MRKCLDKYKAASKKTDICRYCGKERNKAKMKRHMEKFCPDRPNLQRASDKKQKK